MAKGDPCETCGEWIDWGLHHECAPEYQLEQERTLSADLASRLKQAQEACGRAHAGWSADTKALADLRDVAIRIDAECHGWEGENYCTVPKVLLRELRALLRQSVDK